MSANTEVGDLCSICLDSMDREKLAALICRHVFHYDCILKWVHGDSTGRAKTCPICKHAIHTSSIIGPLHYTPHNDGSSQPSAFAMDRSMYVSKQEFTRLQRTLNENEQLLDDTTQTNTELRTQNKYLKRIKGVMEFNASLSTPTAQARMRSWKHMPQDELSLILGGLHQRLRDAERVVEKQQTEISQATGVVDKLKKEMGSLKRKLKRAEQRAEMAESGRREKRQLLEGSGSEQKRGKRQSRRRIQSDDEDTTDDESATTRRRTSPLANAADVSWPATKIAHQEIRGVSEDTDVTAITSDDSDDDEVTPISVNTRARRSVHPRRLCTVHEKNRNAPSSSCYTHGHNLESSHRAVLQPFDVIDLLSDSD